MVKLYPPDPITGKSVFLRARVIGDYNSLYTMSVNLKSLIDEMNFVKAKNAEPGAIRRQVRVNRGLRFWCCGVKTDEEEYYSDLVDECKKAIRLEHTV